MEEPADYTTAAYTAATVHYAIGTAYSKLEFSAFVHAILGATPRYGDVWQEEKWENFQAASRAVLRLSPEMLERILAFGASSEES